MNAQQAMFGDTPSDKILENVRTVLLAKGKGCTLEEVYEEMLAMYGAATIKEHTEWPNVRKLIWDAPTIQRRVRDFQNGTIPL